MKYSLAEYAMEMENALSETTGLFIYGLLDYGLAARKYFGYRADSFEKDVENDGEFYSEITDLNDCGIVTKRYVDDDKLKDSGLVYESSTMLIDENLGMREYFTLVDDTYTLPEDVSVNGNPVGFGSKKFGKRHITTLT